MTQTADAITPVTQYGWHPAIQAMKAAILRGEPEILAYGNRGSGKTLGICDLLLHFAVQFPGMTQRWGRIDRTRMDETVLKTFEEEVLPCYPKIKAYGSSRAAREGYEINGSTIMIHGIRDLETTKSMAADIWWPNEATELTETHWDALGANAREQRFSKFRFQCRISDINPMPPNHWTNTRCPPVPPDLYPKVMDDGTRMPEWMDPKRYARVCAYNNASFDWSKYRTRKILFFHPENPGYWDYFNWAWKRPGLAYVQKELGRYTGTMRARWLEGRPAADEGTVFGGDFDREKHVIDPFPVPWEWPVWLAYDPGYAHPAAAVFVAVANNGQLFIVDEIHGRGIDLQRMSHLIKEKAQKYNVVRWLTDPRGANQKRQESGGRSVREILAADYDLYFSNWKAAEGAGKQSQVEAIRSNLLCRRPLQVFETCTGTIGEFESWKNAMNTKGELLAGDDKYEDSGNDSMDALGGIIADNPTFKQARSEVVKSG